MRRDSALVVLLGSVAMVSWAAPAAGAPAKVSKQDQAILRAGVIVVTDVPSGWTATHQTDTTNKDFKGIAECKQVQAATSAAKKSAARKFSPQFTDPSSGRSTLAEDVVYAFKSVKAASKYPAAYQVSNAATCLQKGLHRALSSTATSVSPITDLQGVGDDNAGYELVATISSGSQSLTLYVDLIMIRVGRSVMGFEFSNAGSRIVQGPDIVNAVINRVAPLAK